MFIESKSYWITYGCRLPAPSAGSEAPVRSLNSEGPEPTFPGLPPKPLGLSSVVRNCPVYFCSFFGYSVFKASVLGFERFIGTVKLVSILVAYFGGSRDVFCWAGEGGLGGLPSWSPPVCGLLTGWKIEGFAGSVILKLIILNYISYALNMKIRQTHKIITSSILYILF